MMQRYLLKPIKNLLSRKMVFLGGPRQVGKTTLARSFLAPKEADAAYFNWDLKEHREKIRSEKLPIDFSTLVLDEIHKFPRWRRLVKGLFDVYGKKTSILVTGSARLDYYRKGGDSLLGRYRYFRLHPFSLPELTHGKSGTDREALEMLFKFGGFPEPLFSAHETDRKIWQRERMSRIIDGDLRDLERVRETSLVELLVDALPSRVGSPLSVKSLREDLEVSHETVAHWLEILERLYVCFRISPYGAPKIRAVKKEQKLYLWDWSVLQDEGTRFENMVASHLLKFCHYREDCFGDKMELRYLRDVDKREVDFVVLSDRKSLFAVECSISPKQNASLFYFKERTAISKFYQVHMGKEDFGDGVKKPRIIPFGKFCDELSLV